MRIVVGIATAGRPAILSETLREIAKQRRLPECVIICPSGAGDVEYELLKTLPYPIKIVSGALGSSSQRNAILRAAKDQDVIVFFDDDFFPSRSYLANVEHILRREANVVIVTGKIIEDGIKGPGLSPEHARERLAAASTPEYAGSVTREYGAYGCNMVVRLPPVHENGIEFDEALPLYGWQEDIDFSRRMASLGKIVRSDSLTGVHLGTKRSRGSGVRFGYSQIANPIYLVCKGTVSLSFSCRLMMKNVVANFVRVFWPEAHVDRRGRLKGNMFAFLDLLRGRLHPSRILEID